ncbi:hypothetical protein, partial [Sanguibacter inulinus]
MAATEPRGATHAPGAGARRWLGRGLTSLGALTVAGGLAVALSTSAQADETTPSAGPAQGLLVQGVVDLGAGVGDLGDALAGAVGGITAPVTDVVTGVVQGVVAPAAPAPAPQTPP